MVERLHLRPELRLYETLIRDTVVRVQGLNTGLLARPLEVARIADGPLVVESELPAGARLADLIETRPEDYPAPGLDAALLFAAQAFEAVAVLHAAGLAHGLVAPGRIIVTTAGRIVLLDAGYALALERLRLNRRTLWTSFGVVAPATSTAPRLDAHLDVAQAAICAIQLALGRELATGRLDELPALLYEIADVAQIRGGQRFAGALDALLRSGLALDGSGPVTAETAARQSRGLIDELGCDHSLLGEMASYQPSADAPARKLPPPRVKPLVTAPTPAPMRPVAQVRAAEPPARLVRAMDVPLTAPPPRDGSALAPTPVEPVHSTTPVAPLVAPPPEPETALSSYSVTEVPDERSVAPASAPAGATEPPAAPRSMPAPVGAPEAAAPATPAFGGATTFATRAATPVVSAAPVPAPVPMPVFAPPAPPAAVSPSIRPITPPIMTAAATVTPTLRVKPQPISHGMASRGSLAEPEPLARALPFVDRSGDPNGRSLPWKAIGTVMAVLTIGLLASRPYLQTAATGEETARQPPAIVETPIPAATTGSLYIESQPAGARVAIDGADVGTTPLRLEQVAAGRHVVTISTGTSTVRRSIKVEGGRELTLDVPVYSGWVAIFAPIRLQVSVGGKTLGTTDSPRIMLPPGRHILTLRNRELKFTMTQPVEIVPGEEQVLNLQPTGAVNVNALPWAEVFVDGTRVGETPLARLPVLLGTREFLFKHPLYGERRVTATVSAGGSAVSVDFTRPANP